MRTLMVRMLPATAVILAAALGGFFSYGALVRSGPMPAAAFSTGAQAGVTAATVPGDPEEDPRAGSAPDGGAARTIAQTLPDVAFTDSTGARRRLSDWRGHALLVNFWAPWCAPCRAEIPLLERLSRERARQGLKVIGVAVDSRAAVLDYARRAAIHYPLLIGEAPGREAVRDLGMEEVLPFSVFVDLRGEIVTLKIGKLSADQAALILDRLDDLDSGRIDLPTARREISSAMARLALASAAADARHR